MPQVVGQRRPFTSPCSYVTLSFHTALQHLSACPSPAGKLREVQDLHPFQNFQETMTKIFVLGAAPSQVLTLTLLGSSSFDMV